MTEFTDSESESEKAHKDTLGNNAIKDEVRTKTGKWAKSDNKRKDESVVDGGCVKENESKSKDVERQDYNVEAKDIDDDDSPDPGALSQPTLFMQGS